MKTLLSNIRVTSIIFRIFRKWSIFLAGRKKQFSSENWCLYFDLHCKKVIECKLIFMTQVFRWREWYGQFINRYRFYKKSSKSSNKIFHSMNEIIIYQMKFYLVENLNLSLRIVHLKFSFTDVSATRNTPFVHMCSGYKKDSKSS